MSYPSLEAVERADVRQLLSWNRFLSSPTDEQRPTLDRIIVRLNEQRDKDPAAYTAASKSIGW